MNWEDHHQKEPIWLMDGGQADSDLPVNKDSLFIGSTTNCVIVVQWVSMQICHTLECCNIWNCQIGRISVNRPDCNLKINKLLTLQCVASIVLRPTWQLKQTTQPYGLKCASTSKYRIESVVLCQSVCWHTNLAVWCETTFVSSNAVDQLVRFRLPWWWFFVQSIMFVVQQRKCFFAGQSHSCKLKSIPLINVSFGVEKLCCSRCKWSELIDTSSERRLISNFN